MDFKGKSVVITGASSGIGEALAVRLARRGARLALGARNESELERVAARCREAGGEAIAVATDVTKPEDCGRLIERAAAAHAGLDALVNNAGISMLARFEDVTDLSIFDRVMRVNYLGAVYATHFALPLLKSSRGLLVAVSSLTGKFGAPTRSGYAASKHAMEGFFDTLRIELLGTGVAVLVVSPGFIATDIRAKALGPDGRPLGESPRDESRGNLSVEACAEAIERAMIDRKRDVIVPARVGAARWLELLAPALLDRLTVRVSRGKPG
ncbi:MAG TPA: SDR family oxidoreductase [Myxococcales bacterium]|nr:SDR family oxidoreductase [Myxococcales bacterium]